MENTIQILEAIAIPEVKVSKVSAPELFISKETGIYRATVKAYTKDDVLVRTYEAFLSQEEYDAWGTDDTYIDNLILHKIGFTSEKATPNIPTDVSAARRTRFGHASYVCARSTADTRSLGVFVASKV